MRRAAAVIGALALALGWLGLAAAPVRAWQARELGRVTGLGHAESVAWDPDGQRAFTGRFGPNRNSGQKDGLGFISQLDGRGRVVVERLLPQSGALNKPKGLWVAAGHLWAPDIDTVWVFSLATGQGRSLAIPGALFLNDIAVSGDKLYVTDTAAHRIYQVQPADFLAAEPQVQVILEQPGLSPNGVWAEANGGLLITSSPRDGSLGSLHRLAPGARQTQAITEPLGRLDGLAVISDGTILYSDWVTGSIYALTPGGQTQKLADGFTGPADFCLIPRGAGHRLLAPDLVKGEIRAFDLTP
ncbi:MAG: hypothetical protein V1797_11720 [Pseudomonadota bacterium]